MTARLSHHRQSRCLPTAAVAIALLTLSACTTTEPSAATTPVDGPTAAADTVTVPEAMQQRMGITVAAVEREARVDEISAPAVLAVDETRTARLTARAEGTIAHVYRNVGDQVGKDAELAELHSHTGHDLLALYRNALADRRQKARELAFATDVEARTTRLVADQAAARQDLERAQASRVAAEQQLAIAETEVQRSSHDLEFFGIEATAEGSMDVSMPIVSPIRGTIIERAITEGTTVSVAAPLFVVSDLSRLWALAEVDETKLGALKAGQTVVVSVTAYRGESFNGRVTAIGATVDPTTRRVVVRIEVPNADGRLKPNMFASVVLSSGALRERLVVPSSAVQQSKDGPIVFVEEPGGVFRAIHVGLGDERDGRVEVREGLSAGQRVAVDGTFLLKSELQKAALAEEG